MAKNRMIRGKGNGIDTSGKTPIFQFLGTAPVLPAIGKSSVGGSSSPPSNILLADIGVAILVDTGSRILGS